MSGVIVVFVVWIAIVGALGLAAIALAPRLIAPGWVRGIRRRASEAIVASNALVGRLGTAAGILLACWSVVLIVGWLLGAAAHKLEGTIDRPAFHWWDGHHLGGNWSTVWWKLTDIGSPTVTQSVALGGAVLVALLYARRPQWWAPSVILLIGYVAEKYSQTILKLVVHRGHPPTTLGSWPSGGMARLIVIYGLIIYFVIKRFWPESPRIWAAGWSFLAVCASIQAYARLNNLEHWTTDVVGGAIYGMLLLLMMVAGYSALGHAKTVVPDAPTPDALGARPRQPVA